jgi:hypothetical protein
MDEEDLREEEEMEKEIERMRQKMRGKGIKDGDEEDEKVALVDLEESNDIGIIQRMKNFFVGHTGIFLWYLYE